MHECVHHSLDYQKKQVKLADAERQEKISGSSYVSQKF